MSFVAAGGAKPGAARQKGALRPGGFPVRVIPAAGRNEVRVEGEGLRVYLTAPPEKGRANRRLVEVLSDHFGVGRSAVEILGGLTSRRKTVRVTLPPGGAAGKGKQEIFTR